MVSPTAFEAVSWEGDIRTAWLAASSVLTFKTLGKTMFRHVRRPIFQCVTPDIVASRATTGQTDGFNPVETCLAETWLQRLQNGSGEAYCLLWMYD